MARKRDPFEVKLSADERQTLADRLIREIDDAISARSEIVGDNARLDHWHELYEGGDPNITKDTPWPGAANLTSWIGTEKVDAFRARVVKTIFAEPVWFVKGWSKTPGEITLIEKFHQWKAEEERLQGYLSRVVHNALIEGTGVLEVSERPVLRKFRQRMRVMVETNEAGIPIADVKGNPTPLLRGGGPVEAAHDADPNLTTLIVADRVMRARGGPQYSVLSLKDFFLLPGHARERKDVWGFAKRVWMRMPDLLTLEQLGVYEGVSQTDTTPGLGMHDERIETPEMTREGMHLPAQDGPTAEKEIFELTFLDDLDADGIQEWYVATIHRPTKQLLRVQKDDLGQARYLLFVPFPRTRSLYGYSLVGHKLHTIIDEHSAWRNMRTDRMKLVIQAPMKRLVGSLWNPNAVPWAPGVTIPVRDMNEVQPMVIADLPSSVIQHMNEILSSAERVGGMADTVAGTSPQDERTLGEVKTVEGNSLIRVDEVVKHLQETMEDLFFIRNEIWKRTLRENPQPIPLDLMAALESRGFQATNTLIGPEVLEGPIRGVPRGSTETADMSVMRQDFTGLLTVLTQFAQAVPTFGMMFQDPNLGKALLDQAVRVFRWDNREVIENAIAAATQKAQQAIAMNGGVPLEPGQPPGAGPKNALTQKVQGEGARKRPRKPRGRPPVDK